MGFGKKFKEAAAKGLKSAGTAAKGAAVTAARSISPDKVKKLSEATIGKENTGKIIKAGEDAHNAVERTVGKDRLDAAKKGALSASSAAVFASPKGMVIAGAAGALVGLVTGKDVIGDVAKIFVGDDEAPETKDPANTDRKPDNSGDDKGTGKADPIQQTAQADQPAKPAGRRVKRGTAPKGPNTKPA